MSWLLFLDESGHDHRNMPYEVRGGVALHSRKLWSFVQSVQRLELQCFGTPLASYGKELKGSTLLDRKRFRFANQAEPMFGDERRKHARSFLHKGSSGAAPSQAEFTAYGQACIEMARGTFQLLRDHEAVVFASAIPKGAPRHAATVPDEYLRKDQVFLFERYFYFLEGQQEHGLLVLDEVQKSLDRKFVRQLEAYFQKTIHGRYRTSWIVPTPFFVASDMAYPVQAADLVIYCVNWGFRLATIGMEAPSRAEIAAEFGPWLNQLQFHGRGYRDGNVFDSFGIVLVSDPYSTRTQ